MELKKLVHIPTLALLLTGATLASAQCLTPARDQLSWWPGNSGAGDAVGGNHGTMRNGAGVTPGFVGPAFIFDGVDDVVVVPTSSSLSFMPTAPMTTDAWVYRTSGAPAMHLWGKRPGCAPGVNYQMVIDEAHGCSLGFGGDGGYACSGTSLPLNVWTHVAGSFDGVTFRLYVNGNLIAMGSGSLGPESAADFEIGGSGTCEHFGGLIDEVDIFSRALSDTEIQAIFQAGAGGKCLGTCIGNYSDAFDGTTLNSK